jgi:hypothetical protein
MAERWFPPYFLLIPVMTWLGKAPTVTMLSPASLRAAVTDAGFTHVEAPDVRGDADHVFLVAEKPA